MLRSTTQQTNCKILHSVKKLLPNSSLGQKLKTYSLAAGALAMVPDTADANIIYTDENPDFSGAVGSQYFLDLNNDGTDEFRIWHNGSSNLYISPLASTAEVLGSGGSTFTYPFALSSGNMISAGAGTFFNNGFSGGFQSLNYGSCSFGNWCSVTDRYIGVRFDIGGNTHYGWVRLDVNNNGAVWTVKDYAYDDVVGNPIAAGAMGNPGVASVASGVIGADVADNGNGLDLDVFYNAGADETTINEYRIMTVLTANAGAFDEPTATAVVAGNYTTVTPIGSGTYQQVLTAGALDVDGNVIVNSVPYTVFILSEADGVNAVTNTLSSGSASVTLEIPADTCSNIAGADIGDLGGGLDLEVSFDAAGNEATLAEYRIMVVKSPNSGAFDLTAAIAVTPGDFTSVTLTGGPSYTQALAAAANDVDGDPVSNGVDYNIFVLNVADGTNATLDQLSGPSNMVTLYRLADPATNLMGIDVDDQNGSEDVQVTFDAAFDEATIGEYRLIVISTVASGLFSQPLAESLGATQYHAVTPTGAGSYTVTLPAGLLSASGTAVPSGISYNIFILSVADGVFANANSMAGPSPDFDLEIEVDGPSAVSAADADDLADGRDLWISYTGAATEVGMDEYRVLTVKTANAGAFDVAAADAASNYLSVVPAGAGTYTTLHNNTSRDVDGDLIVENVPYKVFVLGHSDGVTSTLSNLSGESNEVTLSQGVGAQEWTTADFNVFSNEGLLTIQGSAPEAGEQIEVMDATGRVVYSEIRSGANTSIQINGAAGVYIVRITGDGKQLSKKVLIK
jgi:hypothetical protein